MRGTGSGGAPANPLEREDALARIDRSLAAVVDGELAALGFLAADLPLVEGTLRRFVLEGGKRLRPVFAWWGYRGAGGPATGPVADAALRACCAVELLHAGALIHDDIMDGARVRRGRPALHVAFAEAHQAAGWRGDPAAFGDGAAILMGNLAFAWADAALATAGLPPERLAAALEVFNRLRAEVMAGQFLDVLEANRGEPDEAAVRKVLTYKSGKYTVERPLHLGLALAGGPPRLAAAYSAYGLPLGEAFQLRDDVLGVFGSPAETGKPAGDDLREGKETYLVLRARRRAAPAGRRLLADRLGDPKLSDDGVAELRELVAGCGALADTEGRIATLLDEAKAAIAAAQGVVPAARATLADLADHAATRRA